MAGERKAALSRLNVWFCLLVVLIHVLSEPVGALDHGSLQYALVLIPQRLSFVAVPGFFLLSGLKLCLHEPKHMGRFYRKRARAVLLPYLIAVAVYYLWFIHWGWFTFSLRDLGHYWLIGDVSSHFYFVVALVQFILLTPLFLRWSRKYDPVVLLPLAVIVTWISVKYFGSLLALAIPGLEFPYNDRVFTSYLAYYLAGCCIGRNYEGFLALLRRNRVLIIAAAVAFALGDAAGSWITFSGKSVLPCLEELHLSWEAWGVLLCFLGAVALDGRPLPKLLVRLDQVSYLVYLYHGLAITIFNVKVTRITDMGARLILRAVFVYGVTIFICMLWRVCAVKGIKIFRKEVH